MERKSGPTELEGLIRRLALGQQGQVSRAQLVAVGLGAEAIRHRVSSGRLVPRYRGVYAVGVAPPTREGRWMAAVLACGEGAVLSHLSAAALWKLVAVDPDVIDVSLPSRSGQRSRDGIRVHRPRALSPEDATCRHHIPVTSLPRTLIDLAVVLSARSRERLLDEAEYLKVLDRGGLQAALERNCTRAGAARLRAALRRHLPGTTRTCSALEEAFFLLVRSAGLTQPEVNTRLGPYTVDFLWREAGLVVETDGGASHDRSAQRERDSRRDAWLATAGYRTERFTWHQVTRRSDEVLAVLDALLR